MESRTERLLRAVGNREAYAVVRSLLEAEVSTSGLAERTKLSVAATERTLETLAQGSIVSRRPGSQGAWYVVHWPETFAVLDAARRLSIAVKGTEEHDDRAEGEAFASLEAARGAAPAVRRGRRRGHEM
jgi:DNA-binding IscR family transcriptional regulator